MDERLDMPCARQLLLTFACDVALYRIVQRGSFAALIARAKHIAARAAQEGVSPECPLVELFGEQRDYPNGIPLGWYYRRAYAIARHAPAPRDGQDAEDSDNIVTIDFKGTRNKVPRHWLQAEWHSQAPRVVPLPDPGPLDYFTVKYEHNEVTIKSRRIAGGDGWISFKSRSVSRIFDCAEHASPRSYASWIRSDHASDGNIGLLRMDSDFKTNPGQLSLETLSIAPCFGTLFFGTADQELDQLAAFCLLLPLVRNLMEQNSLSEEERAKAARRAQRINSRVPDSFMPDSGLCYSCGGDVTHSFEHAAAGDAITGCPLCFRSWCD